MLIRRATGPGFAPGITLEFDDKAISLDDIPETAEDLSDTKKHGALIALPGLLKNRIKSGEPLTVNDIFTFQQLQLRLQAFADDIKNRQVVTPELTSWSTFMTGLLGFFEKIGALPKATIPDMQEPERDMLLLADNLPITVEDLSDDAKRNALTGLQPLLVRAIAAKNAGKPLSGIVAIGLQARLNIFKKALAASTETHAPSWIKYIDGLLKLLSRLN
ncbi:MAG: hypothetical protein AAB588_03505 [Patescibacteria group bacterium]